MINVTFTANNIDAVKSELKDGVTRALMECGAICENYAKIGAPVDTGRLRNSFEYKMANENTVAIGTDVEYGKYQELGTNRGIKPKYFLTNALRDHIDEYKGIIQQELK